MKKIWNKLSLRTRLACLYSGLLSVIVCILGVTFFLDTRSLLINYTASHLRAGAKPVIEQWLYEKGSRLPTSHDLKQIAKSLARDLTSRYTVALILDGRGKPIAAGKLLPEEPSPPQPEPFYYRKALAGKNEVSYIISQQKYRSLVMLIPLRQSPTSERILGVAQLSSPLTSMEETLFRHGLSLAIGALITLIIGIGLGFLLISSALAGLNRMIHTCQEISAGDLTQRANLPRHQDEIGRLAHAFDEMVNSIESTINVQRRFIANAAHEIRTPLTGLRGSLEVLMRGSQDDPASFARLSQGMYQEVLRLSRLCEQLLDLAKLDIANKIQKKCLKLDEFFNGFMQEARILAQGRTVVIGQGPPVRVLADPDMLKQILLNLIHNAIQHSGKDSTITLGWRFIPEHVEIWVADNGEGISPEHLPRIFEPFYRGDSAVSQRVKGTGLGLTIVKAMVEAHNGQIQVKSQLDKGTTFLFSLPVD